MFCFFFQTRFPCRKIICSYELFPWKPRKHFLSFNLHAKHLLYYKYVYYWYSVPAGKQSMMPHASTENGLWGESNCTEIQVKYEIIHWNQIPNLARLLVTDAQWSIWRKPVRVKQQKNKRSIIKHFFLRLCDTGHTNMYIDLISNDSSDYKCFLFYFNVYFLLLLSFIPMKYTCSAPLIISLLMTKQYFLLKLSTRHDNQIAFSQNQDGKSNL